MGAHGVAPSGDRARARRTHCGSEPSRFPRPGLMVKAVRSSSNNQPTEKVVSGSACSRTRPMLSGELRHSEGLASLPGRSSSRGVLVRRVTKPVQRPVGGATQCADLICLATRAEGKVGSRGRRGWSDVDDGGRARSIADGVTTAVNVHAADKALVSKALQQVLEIASCGRGRSGVRRRTGPTRPAWRSRGYR